MTSSKPGDDPARTEILHDVDYPLDVPDAPGREGGSGGAGDTATTAFPAAGPTDYSQFAESGGYDMSAPLPFGDQPATIEPATRDTIGRRGTIDLGLFVLRVTVGILLAMRGLQKLFGMFGGPGIDGFTQTLTDSGFDHARILAIAGGAVELVAGVMLVVGLATPVAAAGLLGLVGLGIAVRLTGTDPVPVLSDTTRGLEPSILYAAAMVALLFSGPGRWSADRKWGWSHRPRFSGVVWLVIVAVIAALAWYFLNGTNPLSSTADSAPVTAG
ncbi:DoxX family protein [Dietzia sp. ANT_WB102]|uniref:DoxX family protein n=1 Tax=Dietzia sp. ANT_WB102 TaxID=2597345 RepID=UPI0011EBDDDB|nr:DoxX family protein [Dietzia sp. ANT_WB102]KAA0919482.1 DoxX family protein [Dietzia sp. ANT_WB102]